MEVPYHPPVKRSVEIAGHKTSISLEPVFWQMLKAAAAQDEIPLNALVARIDAERLEAESPPGLAGAVRIWLVARMVEETENGVVLRTVEQAVANAQAIVRKYTGDNPESSVDAFLANRRKEWGE